MCGFSRANANLSRIFETVVRLVNGYQSVVVSFPEIIGKISFVRKKGE